MNLSMRSTRSAGSSFDYRAAHAASDWQRAREFALLLKATYENTKAARSVNVPVMLVTRPPGARLVQGGRILQHSVDGVSQPLLTPALMLCADVRTPFDVTTDLEGFEPRTVSVDAREHASIVVVLEVVPERRVTFPTTLQTGIATGDGWLAVGLRGGKLGVCRTDGSGVRVVELPGLRAVDSTPVVHSGRAFFATNENTIECINLETGGAAKGWPVPLEHGAATELMVGDGRLAVVDGENVLHCWEQGTGTHVWSLSLDSAPSGPPTIHRRKVFIGTSDGRVLVVDAANGETGGVLRTNETITTRVLADGGSIAFGCMSGIVRSVDLDTGKVLWNAQLGQPVTDGTLVMAAEVVCCCSDDTLVIWNKQTGQERARLPLHGTVQPGVRIQGQRLLVRLRREKVRNLPDRDALQAVDLTSSTVLWEFEAEVISPGLFAVDNLTVAFPAATDQVVMFR